MEVLPGSLKWYAELYDKADLSDGYKDVDKASAIDEAQGKLLDKSAMVIYKEVEAQTGVPWWMIGAIHMRECNFNFNLSIKDGSRLENGEDWMQNAISIFKDQQYQVIKHWTLEMVLGKCEAYNGLGYLLHHKNVLSPYLWSMTNLYQKGKYDRDGHFNKELVDEQVGIATLVKSLETMLQIDREQF